ncbi:MAG TPA: M20/M25/M40 family metallo-hydrolase [Thermoanaerobaculia bacterium]|jgi:Zn-dependent M28 family amino/carboxypeptidase|nr:M20/M25/M40 family metallo-hydrolase [Thermoanaerobaculia bacterium]
MRTLLAALLLASLPLAAQTDADRLVSTAAGSTRAYDTLSYLTDNIGARLSGSRGAELAVKWTTRQFKTWGIDVRNEPVMVPHWVRGVERATLVSHNDQRIVLTTLGGSVATPAAGITAELVEVNNYDELKALGSKVKGKIVVYNNPMNLEMVRGGRAFEAYREAVEYRGRGASRAAEYGAVAALIRSVASASLRTPHTGAMRYDEKLPKIPAAAMTVEDSLLVHRLLAKGEKVRMHLTLTPKTLPDVQSANVVAEIRGTEKPEEIVLIGGHLDSWDLGQGAIDDGSGVVMVMETMRLLGELGLKPRRTIRCVLFMNEENGLRGGRAYFDKHKNEKHVAAIETDAGAAAPTGFRTSLKGGALAALEARSKALAAVGADRFESTPETGADTSFLVEAGVPGYGFVPDARHYFDYHHTPADTLDKIDPKELAQDTAAVAGLAWLLANE